MSIALVKYQIVLPGQLVFSSVWTCLYQLQFHISTKSIWIVYHSLCVTALQHDEDLMSIYVQSDRLLTIGCISQHVPHFRSDHISADI
jgi:hypothetical protein